MRARHRRRRHRRRRRRRSTCNERRRSDAGGDVDKAEFTGRCAAIRAKDARPLEHRLVTATLRDEKSGRHADDR